MASISLSAGSACGLQSAARTVGNTAISQTKPGDFDWDTILGPANGSRWLHTGGIFAALSPSTPLVALEALKKAKQYGVVTSFDLNYRESLWKAIGGKAKAQEVNRTW